MSTFPLPSVPSRNWNFAGGHNFRGIHFGALRDNHRLHAASDLIAPRGTDIYAVEDGTVLQGRRYFYHGTYSIVIRHNGFIVRYGEVDRSVPAEIRSGESVREGQVIAHVGQMHHSSMLHFEMYQGDGSGEYTQRRNTEYWHVAQGNYQRRADLLDPSEYLNECASTLTVRSTNF